MILFYCTYFCFRMSRLSLKKRQVAVGMSNSSNSPPLKLSNTIEISSDESDTTEDFKIDESNDESVDSQIQNKDYDEETLYKFQQSTDSVQSDEEVTQLPDTTSLKPMASMFGWNRKRLNLDKDNTSKHGNSAASNEPGVKYGNKKIMKTNEIKDYSMPQVGIQHEQMISGIKVKLPVKPYSSQIAVMNKVRNFMTLNI